MGLGGYWHVARPDEDSPVLIRCESLAIHQLFRQVCKRIVVQIEQGFGRLKGRALSLTPLFLQYEHRVVALVCLLSIALRVLVLMQFVVRRHLQQAGATLKGIYPGQPGRSTAQPTTEMMLLAFRGVTLSRITIDGKLIYHLTPLTTVQKRILALMEVPLESYCGLVT
jgi:transposase